MITEDSVIMALATVPKYRELKKALKHDMYIPILLTLFGFVYSVPLRSEDLRNDNLADLYILPGESRPTLYDVQLFLDPANNDSFNGRVSIRILPLRRTEELVLHAMEMTINSVEVLTDNGDNIYNSSTLAANDTHLLRIRLTKPIDPLTIHIINMEYTGSFAENMFGIYVSTYQNEGSTTINRLITSQLQPTFARRAFPCYDEPHLKAIFRTTIYAPLEYTVVRSNMPERDEADQLKPDIPNWVRHEFHDTLAMSTYLNAYLVSNFLNITNADNKIFDVPFNVYSRAGTQGFADFALEFGQKNMVALQNYTEIPYAFPKMDKVAVPDFAAGAMENWGLVVYREVALLIQEGVTTTAIRQNIARIITHENMHQWFGNEVSPLSWTFTWLNEGFANFFENYATDLVLPQFRMMDQFVLQMQGVMQNDAVLGVNPMTYPVYTPSQIISTFNAVAYQKSGCVIRMMQHFLTPEVFRKGLSIFVKDNKRGAVGPPHLYAALQQALDESTHEIPFSIVNILNRWTNQGGFPVITVRRSAINAQSVSVSQERFLTDPSLSSNYRWHIPVNWVLSTDVDFEDTRPGSWITTGATANAIDIPGLSEAEWFIFNKKRTGYYRVNYNTENWVALAKVLNNSHETIDLLNRAQIIDDSFNLARNGRLSYVHPLEISQYLVREKDYIPWASANAVFGYLDIVLSGSEVHEFFQYYMLNLTAPLYRDLGFEPSANEEHVQAFHRNNILNINCRHGNIACVNRAQSILQAFRTNPSQNRPNPDIQTTVFCSGLRGGDAVNFNFLWNQYLISTDSTEQSIYLNSLGCTTNDERLNFYLRQVIEEDSSVRDQDRHTILVATINSSPENMEKALDFIIDHFHEIQPRVQGLSGTTNILGALANRLNTEAHNDKMDEFESRHSSIFTAGEIAAVRAIRTNIDASINWNKNNLAVVDSWLTENYGNGASGVTASLLLLVSCLLALFNHVQPY